MLLPTYDEELAPAEQPRVELRLWSFSQVFKEYSRYVFGVLQRRGVAKDDLDDVAQIVFLAIHAGLPGFNGRSTMKTWVCGICRHKAFDYLRTAKCRGRALSNDPPAREPISEDDPHRGLLLKENVDLVRTAIARLPEEQREVFELYEIDELPMKDVAAMLGCPLDTAYTRHRVAKQRLQAFLRRRGGA